MEIYCDGACKGNPGPGGWGVYCKEKNVEIFGGSAETTNNKMELTAAIEALKLAEKEAAKDVIIYTDSNYVVNGITKWILGWKKNGWKSASGAVKNQELWQELDALNLKVRARFVWVKAHSGIEGNEKADELSNKGVPC